MNFPKVGISFSLGGQDNTTPRSLEELTGRLYTIKNKYIGQILTETVAIAMEREMNDIIEETFIFLKKNGDISYDEERYYMWVETNGKFVNVIQRDCPRPTKTTQEYHDWTGTTEEDKEFLLERYTKEELMLMDFED